MKTLLAIFVLLFFSPKDDPTGSLSIQDCTIGRLSFNLIVDSAIVSFGKPSSVERSVGYCGKGPKMRGGQQVEGDSIYCDSIVTYSFDSLTICTNLKGYLEYYVFTKSDMVTKRGIRIGDTKEKILKAYGIPKWMDSVYVFSEPLPNKNDSIRYNDSIQYVVADDYNGIEFLLSDGRVTRIYVGRGSAD
jgi:hypothetical protein